MPIKFTCSTCNNKMQAPDSAAGKKVRCPSCKAAVAVPEPDDLVDPDDDLVGKIHVPRGPNGPRRKATSRRNQHVHRFDGRAGHHDPARDRDV